MAAVGELLVWWHLGIGMVLDIEHIIDPLMTLLFLPNYLLLKIPSPLPPPLPFFSITAMYQLVFYRNGDGSS